MINLPNINTDDCPPPMEAACAVAGSDPNNPPASMVLEPERVVRCSTAVGVQFQASIQNANGKLQLSGVAFSSSDPYVVAIDPNTGLATSLNAGTATISASWSEFTAFGEMKVLGDTCCDAIQVGTMILIEESQTMGDPFNAAYPDLLTVAKVIAGSYVAEMLGKDLIGLITFAADCEVLQQLTNDVPTLETLVAQAAIKPSASGGSLTDIAGAIDLAITTLDACAAVPAATTTTTTTPTTGDTDAPLHGHGPPAPGLGSPGATYVDDDNNGFYWKSQTGWNP